MSNFAIELVKQVRVDGKITFYKLLEDDVCLFDEFCEEVEQNDKEKMLLEYIFAYMDYVAQNDDMLPSTKLNSIKEKGKVIGYEFKKKELRVYFIKKKPNAYIVLGGYKSNQDKDVVKFSKISKEFLGKETIK